MPSLDDLKKRIKSVKSTQKITKAMKMVAAAKLRKAQENAEKGRPYSQKMQNLILNLTKSINDPDNAPSDGPNMVKLEDMNDLIKKLIEIDNLVKEK